MTPIDKFSRQTLIVLAIFIVTCLISYDTDFGRFTFITFKIGYPYEFFLKGWQCGADSPTIIWTVQNLLYDCCFCFLAALNYRDSLGWKQANSKSIINVNFHTRIFFSSWVILTVIVGLFLFNNLQNASGEEFSRTDLLNFSFVSIWIFGILKAIKITYRHFKASNEKHNS